MQELLEVGISFIAQIFLLFDLGGEDGTVIRNRYISGLIRRDVNCLGCIYCLIGSDIGTCKSRGVLSIIDSDVSFLGLIRGLIGSDIGRYVRCSIRRNIHLDRSCDIFERRRILGLVCLRNNLNGIVLGGQSGRIILILLFLFDLHFFCLRRWLIEIVVHDSKIGACVHFLTCSGIINIENVCLESVIFFVLGF